MSDRPQARQIDSWRVAEDNAAAWMRFWGYSDAGVTPGGPDAGIDVRSRRALAQVKWEAAQTGTPALQRLVGARRTDHHMALLFFSGAGYSAPAVEYADDMDIALFKYALDGAMAPVNAPARRLVAKRQTQDLAATVTDASRGRRSGQQHGGVESRRTVVGPQLVTAPRTVLPPASDPQRRRRAAG